MPSNASEEIVARAAMNSDRRLLGLIARTRAFISRNWPMPEAAPAAQRVAHFSTPIF